MNTEIKVLDLEKGGGVLLKIQRAGALANQLIIKDSEIKAVVRLLVAKMKGQEIVEGELYANSGYGANTRRPFVELSHGISWSAQISPTEAREYAAQILEAAESAETDAFIAEFFKDAFGGDEHKLYSLLNEFRAFREAERAKSIEERADE